MKIIKYYEVIQYEPIGIGQETTAFANRKEAMEYARRIGAYIDTSGGDGKKQGGVFAVKLEIFSSQKEAEDHRRSTDLAKAVMYMDEESRNILADFLPHVDLQARLDSWLESKCVYIEPDEKTFAAQEDLKHTT